MKWIELFLALRFLRPTRSYVSVITVLSVLGVIFGVMVLIVVLSVMRGFESELQKKVIGFNAHITVLNYGIVNQPDQLKKRILEDKHVQAASPFVLGPVLAQYHGKISTPFIKGIRAEESEQVIPMHGFLKAGEWRIDPEHILVGSEWAQRNGAAVGDRVIIHAPRNLEGMLAGDKSAPKSIYLPSEYTISGIFETGMFDYDFNFFLLDLQEAQRLYNLGDGVHGIAVRLKDVEQAALVKNSLNRWLSYPDHATTWMDQNRQLFSAIALERRVMSFLLFFVMLVAAFGISSTLLTITVQRSKQIGLLKAIGAQNEQILAVFTLYGFIVGIGGAILGVIGGLTVVSFRNEFSHWLAQTFGIEVFPAAIYHFSAIPAIVDWPSIFIIAAAAIVVSTLAAFIPAWHAARFDPVQTLRSE